MGRLFVRAILSLCLGFAVSGLALSVGLAPASSPKGGAFGGLVERSETERATVNLWKMHDRKEKNL